MANNLSESLDHFGVPLTEGVEIEVEFDHAGRNAVAVFDVSGGHVDRTHGRDFPPEDVEPETKIASLHYRDDGSQIPAEEVLDLDRLESEAIEKYLDHYHEYNRE